MKSMVAIEKIIKELELRVAVAKGQLNRHNNGEEKLSLLAESSAENSLEQHVPLLDKYRNILKDFEKFEKLDSYEHRRLRAAIIRKKYYKYNKKDNAKGKIKYKENDEKIEASMIIDELPEEFVFDTQELFNISYQALQQYIPFHSDAQKDLQEIQNEFNMLIKNFTDENIKSLELLNYMIPIVIFHFKLFKLNILEDEINEAKEKKEDRIDLEFFPKYHDWWITELWTSHIAYFSLYRWKKSVVTLCKTDAQKYAWKILFNNWIFLKTLLSEKSNPAFEYQYIFDTLMHKHVDLVSEIEPTKVLNHKKEMEEFIQNEDLLALSADHNVITPYVKYKESHPSE